VPAFVSYHLRRLGSRLHRMRIALRVRGWKGLLDRMATTSVAAGPVAVARTPGRPAAIPEPTAALPVRRRVLMMDVSIPRPDRDSGSLRAYNLMRLLRADGHDVDFLPDDGAWADGYAEALRGLGVGLRRASRIAGYPSWFARHLADYDALIVSRYHLAEFLVPLARRIAPQVRVVLDTVDLHHLREQREAELRGDDALRRLARSTRRRELAAISAADTTWVVSPVERELLRQELPSARIEVLPNIHETVAEPAGSGMRQGLLFVGGARHPPNADAIGWLLEDVFPRIRRELPDCELHLVGEGISGLPQARRAGAGVVVHDHVPDLAPLLDSCRIGLAPLRYGAGIKGKINLYMAHGMPVVATACAAEGMHLEHEHDVLIADDAQGLASAVVRACREPALWQRLADNGVDNVRRHFSFDAARSAIAATFAPGR